MGTLSCLAATGRWLIAPISSFSQLIGSKGRVCPGCTNICNGILVGAYLQVMHPLDPFISDESVTLYFFRRFHMIYLASPTRLSCTKRANELQVLQVCVHNRLDRGPADLDLFCPRVAVQVLESYRRICRFIGFL